MARWIDAYRLRAADVDAAAQDLGLVELPILSLSVTGLEEWLRSYGPIWTAGHPVNDEGQVGRTGHIVVLAGVRGHASDAEVLVYNPWPVHVGSVSWRPISHLHGIQSMHEGEAMREVVFLRMP